jgi:small-conductance mechanosensitive channel
VSQLHDLFSASVGASAALMGLLFVAISLAPHRVFGAAADARKRSDADAAFTALANVFFTSLAALLPQDGTRAVIGVAAVTIVRLVVAKVTLLRRYPGRQSWRHLGAISLALYALEGVAAARTAATGVLDPALVYVVFGLYGYALGVAWQLLGANER